MQRLGWTRLGLAIALAISCGPMAPALAHHSYAMFDQNKPLTITGRVSAVDWRNPHAYVYLEAKDPEGQVQKYLLECSSPNELLRWGWKRNTIKVGDVITADLYLLRDGRPGGLLFKVTTADGTEFHAH